MQRVEAFFRSFDMFAAPATLRAKGSSTITRTSAGVISFVLVCYFSFIFIKGLINIFSFESITSSPTFKKIPLSEVLAQGFMFGVGSPQIDPQYFTMFNIVTSVKSTKSGVLYNITMSPCKAEQWRSLGDDYQQQFDLHYLSSFYCPESPQDIKIINSTIIGNATYFQIIIEPTSSFSWSKLKKLKQIQNHKFNMFFLDQVVIPNQQQAVQHFVNVDNFVFLSQLKQHSTLIRLSNYQVSTDYSLIPLYLDIHTIFGRFISDSVLWDRDLDTHEQNSKIIFQLTNNKYIYKRKVGKIDEMFSYAGGLFALVIWCLAFFVSSFNQYRYELMVAETTFNYDKDGNKFLQKDFNFARYIKYSIYVWIQTYFFYKPKWRDCRLIEQTITQANNQMDVTRLFRKLQFLQMALIHTNYQSENMIVALTEPRTLQQVKQQRLVLQYYFAIIEGKPAATVSDARDGNAKRFMNLRTDVIGNLTNSKVQFLLQDSQRQVEHTSSEQIQWRLKKYLNLDKFPGVCQAIAKYPVALDQARKVKLSKQLEQTEEKLTNYFLKLGPVAKLRVMDKIPLKIIHRLCMKSQEMQDKIQVEIVQAEDFK